MRKRVSRLGESGANHSGGQAAKIGVECLKLVTDGLNPDLQPRLAVNPGGGNGATAPADLTDSLFLSTDARYALDGL